MDRVSRLVAPDARCSRAGVDTSVHRPGWIYADAGAPWRCGMETTSGWPRRTERPEWDGSIEPFQQVAPPGGTDLGSCQRCRARPPIWGNARGFEPLQPLFPPPLLADSAEPDRHRCDDGRRCSVPGPELSEERGWSFRRHGMRGRRTE